MGRTKKAKPKKITPLMQQYERFKAKHPDAVLLFRVGDFYETFGTDAEKTAATLDIVLTKRHNGSAGEVPLAGFPYHALESYLPRLVKAGLRVAICEQLEEPSKAKKIVKRGVTEVITPGVALNDAILDRKSNNFLAAVHLGEHETGVAFVDVSTGSFQTASGPNDYVEKLLRSFRPAEVVLPREQTDRFEAVFGGGFSTYPLDDWAFTVDGCEEVLCRQFKVNTLKGFGLDGQDAAIRAAGAALHYLDQTRQGGLDHIHRITRLLRDDHLWLDRFTIRNLELIDSPHDGAMTLIDVLDETITAMGGRMLRHWILFPLVDINAIDRRLDAVGFLRDNDGLLDALRDTLKEVGDLERLAGKVAAGRITPREVVHLRTSLQRIPDLMETLHATDEPGLRALADAMDPCADLVDRLVHTIEDEAPALLHKAPTIRPGVDDELDECRELQRSGKDRILAIQQKEAAAHGISSLKVGFNNVFGYYLEVRNTHRDKVPDDWIRKQTLTSAERYITPELKDIEQRILGAEDRITALEERLFGELVAHIAGHLAPLLADADAVARLDVLGSFAVVAEANDYCRPSIDDSLVIDVRAGRHPVIERQLPPGERYVPNDVLLDSDDVQIMMITGPNMSGKSAVLRQTALITLLAQTGCFVPARSARIGLVDRIFTRVGASDNISSGESTFMVEMNETANIVNNVSARSLILLDEIGRGTSTYDGISIAWSVAEYLHDHPAHRPKTLFATHYHELNELANTYDRIRNFSIATREADGRVVFLRTLVPGGSKHSFGIHVAEMAGMPPSVLDRARGILRHLERKSMADEDSTMHRAAEIEPRAYGEGQLAMFGPERDPAWDVVRAKLLSIDVNRLTPVQALVALEEVIRLTDEAD